MQTLDMTLPSQTFLEDISTHRIHDHIGPSSPSQLLGLLSDVLLLVVDGSEGALVRYQLALLGPPRCTNDL